MEKECARKNVIILDKVQRFSIKAEAVSWRSCSSRMSQRYDSLSFRWPLLVAGEFLHGFASRGETILRLGKIIRVVTD